MTEARTPARTCLECGRRLGPAVRSRCPGCGASLTRQVDFRNSEERLKQDGPRLIAERRQAGLEGLVGGLRFIVINTEPEHHQTAVEELLLRTGLSVLEGFEDELAWTIVLRAPGSADVLVTARKGGSPFAAFPGHPKTRSLPATRLETLAFACRDVVTYARIQRERGVTFMTEAPVETDAFRFLQTTPSRFTGNSVGLIESCGPARSYRTAGATDLDGQLEKPDKDYLTNVGRLDHAATRVRAEERDAAILEFITLTNYRFDFAIYVKSLNSITNVARLSAGDFAMVFTSGIAPFVDDTTSGPTERFIHDYGPRVHHLAWETSAIDDTFASLKRDGQAFLLDLVGSPEEGLKQTFSAMSPHTLLVNEYIHRYGDFDGFFTRSNVTLLTEATERQ